MITIGDKLEVIDSNGISFGVLAIEEQRSGAWCGTFAPSPSFGAVQLLFQELESVVNQQSFEKLDDIESRITALGLRGRVHDRLVPLLDIQIFTQGASVRIETNA
jgi:hypothetical protein